MNPEKLSKHDGPLSDTADRIKQADALTARANQAVATMKKLYVVFGGKEFESYRDEGRRRAPIKVCLREETAGTTRIVKYATLKGVFIEKSLDHVEVEYTASLGDLGGSEAMDSDVAAETIATGLPFDREVFAPYPVPKVVRDVNHPDEAQAAVNALDEDVTGLEIMTAETHELIFNAAKNPELNPRLSRLPQLAEYAGRLAAAAE